MIARALAADGSCLAEVRLDAAAWAFVRAGMPWGTPGAVMVAYEEEDDKEEGEAADEEDDGAAALPALFRPAEEVARLDAEAGWNPSPDQAEALAALREALWDPGEYSLTGAAGSGKTSCLLALLRSLSPGVRVVLIAPTWRAANRMTEVTGCEAVSLHSAVYGRPVEERRCPCGAWSAQLMDPEEVDVEVEEDGVAVKVKLPRYVCPTCKVAHEDATRFEQRLVFVLKFAGSEEDQPAFRVVVCDESSMVHPREADAVRTAFLGGDPPTSLLWVGDLNQLPFVREDDEAADPAGAPDLLHPTAALHKIHRQAAGSPILTLAHALKTVPEVSQVEYPWPWKMAGVRIDRQVTPDVPARWAADLRCRGQDVALICVSNRTRAALNALVRQHSGAARVAGGALIPGDRLLSRVNTPIRIRTKLRLPPMAAPAVRNGELWTVAALDRVDPGTCMIGDGGRAPRKNPYYEHDRILEDGVAVWRLRAVRLGDEEVIDLLLVTARDAEDRMLLESGMIRGGADPGKARQRAREIARAWCAEYAAAILDRQPEFEHRQGQARDWRIARAFWLVHARTNRKKARDALRRMATAGGHLDRLKDIQARLDAGDFDREDPEIVVEVLPNTWAGAIECPDVRAYCRWVYGALDVERVTVFDEGECGTVYSWQGAQADHAGFVADGAFWGTWRNDRESALRTAYTAVTRAKQHLALFGVKKEGAA